MVPHSKNIDKEERRLINTRWIMQHGKQVTPLQDLHRERTQFITKTIMPVQIRKM